MADREDGSTQLVDGKFDLITAFEVSFDGTAYSPFAPWTVGEWKRFANNILPFLNDGGELRMAGVRIVLESSLYFDHETFEFYRAEGAKVIRGQVSLKKSS